MTDQPSAEFEIQWESLLDLLNAASTRAIYWQAAELLDDVELTNEEVDALLKMPTTYRQKVIASLLDYAEAIREGSRSLDAQLMRLTGELV